MNGTKRYPICENGAAAREMALTLGQVIQGGFAVATPEFRPPRKGEWYLSGARIGAYQAPNDLTESFRIAKIDYDDFGMKMNELISKLEKPGCIECLIEQCDDKLLRRILNHAAAERASRSNPPGSE